MAAEKAVSLASKPQMRGLLNSAIKKNLTIAITSSIIAAFAYKVAVGDARKKAYAEFYRTYDGEKEHEIMRQKGLFQSC